MKHEKEKNNVAFDVYLFDNNEIQRNFTDEESLVSF